MTVRIVTLASGAPSMSIAWGDGTEILTAGQLISVEPGSALETAIGGYKTVTPQAGERPTS